MRLPPEIKSFGRSLILCLKGAGFIPVKRRLRRLGGVNLNFMQTKNQVKILAEILFSATENKSDQQQREIARNFLKVLKNKKKIYLLPQIFKELQKISKKDEIELIFSREIQGEDIKKIEEKLRSVFGKEKIFKIKINKRLISGFVAKTNNYLIDASINGVLERMKIY